MRFLTPILVVLLLVSVIANGVMWLKFHSGRSILTVNDASLSKVGLDQYLEVIYGTDVKANFVRRALLHDAAVKAGVAPNDDEVNERYDESKQNNWQTAAMLNSNPWLADEARRSIREQIELNRLRVVKVKPTADELKDEYNLQPPAYDTPNRAETELALLKSGPHTEEIVQHISQGGSGTDPVIKPAAIMSNYRGEVRFLGDNNIYTFTQHYGTPEQSLVFGMKPGETKRLPASAVPPEFKNAGYVGVVVRLIRIIPGHKADLEDPKLGDTNPREKDYKKTKDTLESMVASKRANPPQEMIRDLFQSAKVEAEDPADIENIKLKLFPPLEINASGTGQK